MKLKIDTKIVGIFLMLTLALQVVQANNIIVKTTDTNAEATAKIKKVMREGGVITFEAGSWIVNLNGADFTPKAEISIIGANILDSNKLDSRGAFDDDQYVKTTVTFTGSPLKVTSACPKVSIKNIKWVGKGIDVAKSYQPDFFIKNVFFDVSNGTDIGEKVIIDMSDGASGVMEYVTFYGFSYRAMISNRTRPSNKTRPVSSIGKLVINRCKFEAEPEYASKGYILGQDAGNDEYAPTWNYNGKEIKNSLFINCGFSFSKGSHIKVLNNIFEMSDMRYDLIHLEEFSHDIIIDGNTVIGSNNFKKNFITLGGKQTCYDITITNNTIKNTGKLGGFVSGSNVKKIIISGNKIENPTQGKEYISFWGCGNENITINQDLASGFGTIPSSNYQSKPCVPIVTDGSYFITYNKNEYLGIVNGEVQLVESTEKPKGKFFQWKITWDRMNYYKLENLGNTTFLEVAWGPNANEQKLDAGSNSKKYEHGGKPIFARAFDNYLSTDRQPIFEIYAKNGGYCLLPGGNERRSDIRKLGIQVALYTIRASGSNEYADYSWSLIKSMNTTSGN